MLTERFRRPLIVGCAVEANLAAYRLPDAHEHPRKTRFAGAAGPDDAQAAAGIEGKVDVVATSFCTPGGATLAGSTVRLSAGLRAPSALLASGNRSEELVERIASSAGPQQNPSSSR